MVRRFLYITIVWSLLASPSMANLLVNGSFEQGINPGPSFITLVGGSTDITGWTVTHFNIDYVSGYWQNADGARSLDLNGTGPGGIEQTFATIPGAQYEVQFSMAGNPNTGAWVLKPMRVQAAGQSADFVFNTTGFWTGNMGWTRKSWIFAAAEPLTTLEFYSLEDDPDDCCGGAALDNVNVDRVGPVAVRPASWSIVKNLYQ